MKKTVLITGGTGFIGKHLIQLLIQNGFAVNVLSRTQRQATSNVNYYTWNVDSFEIEEEAVLSADYIIHLAGAGIADERWTAKRKKVIIESRVRPVQLIESVLKKHDKNLEAFISASGIGIYGADNSPEIMEESSAAATDFVGQTCKVWEASADALFNYSNRIVKIRTGLVLGRNGGFLKKMVPPFRWRLGTVLGSGKQYMPWIHIDDLCAIYLEALQNTKMMGAYNAAINDHTTNSIFSTTLAQVLGYKLWLPAVPSFLIKLALGELSVLLLKGKRVSSDKIENLGFQFGYNKLSQALQNCV
ncbi:TIGR01777 family oxidoreductase [Flavobacterium sp. UMI-01]|uniref:TIGR01777 family oxidoreductase n=1 Tax=Flavobacterium sp. UMI-01 TaxID=1441053 RepID=UPI001C7E0C8A|nr:TIGR01777 family oxidoreductase [Flavobacterium sp. UMI-01]GIZ08441.1 NAD-dependent epimerase [Flavobacterium sp. UMI-01]